MATQQHTSGYQGLIGSIIQEVYTGCKNLGLITDHIPAGVGTTDFDLPNNQKVRVLEKKNTVCYFIFRAK